MVRIDALNHPDHLATATPYVPQDKIDDSPLSLTLTEITVWTHLGNHTMAVRLHTADGRALQVDLNSSAAIALHEALDSELPLINPGHAHTPKPLSPKELHTLKTLIETHTSASGIRGLISDHLYPLLSSVRDDERLDVADLLMRMCPDMRKAIMFAVVATSR